MLAMSQVSPMECLRNGIVYLHNERNGVGWAVREEGQPLSLSPLWSIGMIAQTPKKVAGTGESREGRKDEREEPEEQTVEKREEGGMEEVTTVRKARPMVER